MLVLVTVSTPYHYYIPSLVIPLLVRHNLVRRMEFFSPNGPFSEPTEYLTADAPDASGADVVTLAPVEAARRLGVTRSRIYALVQQGELDDVGSRTLRVTLASVERRLAADAPVGEPIKPLGAWAILALASSDAAFRAHVAARLSPWEQSRARLRIEDRGLLALAQRLRQRGVARRYARRRRVAAGRPRGCTGRAGRPERRAAARLAVARR
jgi:hypothetical protein